MEALAGLAISIVAPYMVKGAEAFAQEVGTEAFTAVKAVVDRLRKWWSNEPVAAATAEALPSDPEKYSEILAGLLSSDLAKNEELASELKTLTDHVGPHAHVVQRIEVADGVTGADIEELVTGTVHVEQDMKEAHDVTGFKAKRVGG